MSDLISRQEIRKAMYHEAMEKDSDEQKWDGERIMFAWTRTFYARKMAFTTTLIGNDAETMQ